MLAEARKKRGWTQVEAASRLGVSQPYLSLLEKGARPVTRELARRFVAAFGASPTLLPLDDADADVGVGDSRRLASDLGQLGYPGFAYLRGRRQVRNPAAVALAVLGSADLEPRVVGALVWLLFTFDGLDLDWMVSRAKERNLQNRLGFVVEVCLQLEAGSAVGPHRVEALAATLAELEKCRLAAEGTLCQDSMTPAVRRATLARRAPTAERWGLATAWRPEDFDLDG